MKTYEANKSNRLHEEGLLGSNGSHTIKMLRDLPLRALYLALRVAVTTTLRGRARSNAS